MVLDRLAQKADRRRLGRLGSLLADALRLVWASSRTDVVALAVLAVAASSLAAVQVVVTRVALGRLLAGGDQQADVRRALPWFLVLAVVAGVSAASGSVQGQRQRYLAELVSRRSTERLLDVTTSVPLERFDAPGFFDHLQRVRTYALLQPVNVVTGVLGLAGGLVGSTGLVVALLVVQPLLVPVLVLGAVPVFLLQRSGSRIEYAFALEQTPALRARTALSEVLVGRQEAKEVRALGVGPAVRARYDELYDSYLVAMRQKVRRRLRLSLLATLSTAVVSCLAVALLLLLVSRGRVSLASAGATVAGIGLLGRQLEQLASGAGSLLEAGLFLEDLDEFLAEAPEGGSPAARTLDPATPPSRAFRELRVESVSYRYPGAERDALHDVSLQLREGEVLALVGENGSGKTTLSKVLAHLYAPTAGRVLWDGEDAAALDPLHLRNSTAVLFQDFVHYELALLDNVRFGRPARPVDAALLDRLEREAGLQGVVAQAPHGWDTHLTRRFTAGTELSGGQWQRVAMARALFRDAPFVVLDEPTAALDPRAEAALFAQLRDVLAGRTVVLVSHRFGSVRYADRIAVLEGGQLVELGNHDELMALAGRYAEMFTLQAAAFTG